MELLNKISASLEKLVNIFLGAAFAVMTVVYFSSIVARYALNTGIPWAEELTRYLNVWLVMLGSSVVARKNGHTNISVLELALGNKGVYAQVFQNILTAIFFTIVGIIGFNFAGNISHVSANLRLPLSIVYIIMSVGFILIGFQSVVWIINALHDKKKEAV